MSKNTRAVVASAVLLLSLAGCSAQSTSSNAPADQSSAPQAVAPSTSSSVPTDVVALGDVDKDFLTKVKGRWEGDLTYSDAELIAFSHQACALLDSGQRDIDIKVLPVTGTQENADNNTLLVRRGELHYCQQWQ